MTTQKNSAYHCKVYVGPTLVADLACKFRAAHLTVTTEGTEHIHVIVNKGLLVPEDVIVAALRNAHGTTFGISWRDISVMRETDHVTEGCFA